MLSASGADVGVKLMLCAAGADAVVVRMRGAAHLVHRGEFVLERRLGHARQARVDDLDELCTQGRPGGRRQVAPGSSPEANSGTTGKAAAYELPPLQQAVGDELLSAHGHC